MTINYPYKILKEPEQKTISLNEIKSYLRINYDYDDDLLTKLCKRAISYAENFLRYAILEKEVYFKIPYLTQISQSIRMPLAYCKKVLKISCTVKRDNYDLQDNDYLVTDDRCNIKILKTYLFKDLRIIYKTSDFLKHNDWLQQAILEHIRDMYDHKDMNLGLQKLYQNHRRILL